jgi:signal transduction histidine kinase
MEAGPASSTPVHDAWSLRTRELLHPLLPEAKNGHFWVVQGLVVAVAALHTIIEMEVIFPGLEETAFVPITLFFVPVIYSALKFGLRGSARTAVWATIVTIPNLVFLGSGLDMLGDLTQLAIVNVTAVILGYRVDRDKAGQQRAKTYAAYVIDAQEKERQNIARDLHDESLQTMVLLCQQLDAARSSPSLPSATGEKLKEVRGTAERAATGLRNFARELRPPILDDLGMTAAIRKLLDDCIDRINVEGQLKIVGEEHRLRQDVEVNLFRIVQEALANVAHHAKATNVTVTIVFMDREVKLEIRDNGQGFVAPINADGLSKFGLIGMRERTEMLGGRLKIRSSPGNGTRIEVSIPLENNRP